MDARRSGSVLRGRIGHAAVTGNASSGLLPQVTIGASWAASNVTSRVENRVGVEGSVRQ